MAVLGSTFDSILLVYVSRATQQGGGDIALVRDSHNIRRLCTLTPLKHRGADVDAGVC
jgi:hypothetical protein